MHKKNGFTLIELLVVIAIIAILAAILFPVFAQARESARATACVSNMKQIMMGMLQYSQDYDEIFPGSRIQRLPGNVDGDAVNGKIIGFRTVTIPYIKNYQIWQCPSNPNRNVATEEADKQFRTSYASNGARIYDSTGPAQAAVGRPAETFMFLESTWSNNDLGDWVGRINAPTACTWGPAFYQHRGANRGGSNVATMVPNGGMGNWAFFDGHAKSHKYSYVHVPKGGPGQWYNGYGRECSAQTLPAMADNSADDCASLAGDVDSNLCPLYK